MTIHQGISSHILTGKCLSLFSLNHNKSQMLFISSSNHKHIRNINPDVFSMVVMTLGFQKILVFSDKKMHIFKKKNMPKIQLQRTYILSNHHFLLSSHFSLFYFYLFMIFMMNFFFFFQQDQILPIFNFLRFQQSEPTILFSICITFIS